MLDYLMKCLGLTPWTKAERMINALQCRLSTYTKFKLIYGDRLSYVFPTKWSREENLVTLHFSFQVRKTPILELIFLDDDGYEMSRHQLLTVLNEDDIIQIVYRFGVTFDIATEGTEIKTKVVRVITPEE
jgi:hypothetical protein